MNITESEVRQVLDAMIEAKTIIRGEFSDVPNEITKEIATLKEALARPSPAITSESAAEVKEQCRHPNLRSWQNNAAIQRDCYCPDCKKSWSIRPPTQF